MASVAPTTFPRWGKTAIKILVTLKLVGSLRSAISRAYGKQSMLKLHTQSPSVIPRRGLFHHATTDSALQRSASNQSNDKGLF
jgi:hypothetical protein